jgi:arylamine N-acetyltransferase
MSLRESQDVVYTQQQIDAYLSRISLPTSKYKKSTPKWPSTEDGLAYLSQLQKYHLTEVPFENLSLHYSKRPTVSLDIDDLFEKIVKRHRGGYCMENNSLFGTLLQSLGFEVVPTGARVWNGVRFSGW